MSDFIKRQKVYDYLNQHGFAFSVTEHPAVVSIDEMKSLGIFLKGDVCKNLFLRDSAGKRHFLVTLPNDKVAPLKALQQTLGTSRLSFASQKRLGKYLNLVQGEVPLWAFLTMTIVRLSLYLMRLLRAILVSACIPMTIRQQSGFLLPISIVL